MGYTACFAGLQNLTSRFIFSNINQHLFITYLDCKEDVMINNANDILELINKKETQSFQLPK